jgi:hypothetical protein
LIFSLSVSFVSTSCPCGNHKFLKVHVLRGGKVEGR